MVTDDRPTCDTGTASPTREEGQCSLFPANRYPAINTRDLVEPRSKSALRY
jgi:hypothetical protein